MIVNVKYFYEVSQENYENYNKLWMENRERMCFLTNLEKNTPKERRYRVEFLKNQLIHAEIHVKTILSIRFPKHSIVLRDPILKNILNGKGFQYDENNTWFPSEVWIYNPFN